jgi:protein phosphatase
MGGKDSGEVASKLAVRTAIRKLMDNMTEASEEMPENSRQWLEMAVSLANEVVHEKAHAENKKMGTTLVIAVVVGNDVHVANVGNSRAYLISPSGIRQVTHDQSMAQSMVDSGILKPEEAAHNPYRKILTQSVGSHNQVAIDSFTETLQEDESLLLCSDGLWNMLGDTEILHIVRTADSPAAACQALVDACNQKDARDDIAAVLVRQGSIFQPAESDKNIQRAAN